MKIFSVCKSLIDRYFSEEETIYLLLLAIVCSVIMYFFGSLLAPILMAIFLAFCFVDMSIYLERYMSRHFASGLIVFLIFGCLFLFLFLLLPILYGQGQRFLEFLPTIINNFHLSIKDFHSYFSHMLTLQQIETLFDFIRNQVLSFQKYLLNIAFNNVFSVFVVLTYTMIVPILVFFFLKDRDLLFRISNRIFLPKKSRIGVQIFAESTLQLKYYLKGKLIEAVIVASLSYILWKFFEMPYAFFLSILLGIAGFIPFIGALIISIPVCILAFLVLEGTNLYLFLFLYGLLQFFDGYILVPVLFSKVVNVHPVFILLSLIIFGGLWGFLGLFFAIPLLTFIRAVYEFWPKDDAKPVESS